MTWIAATFVAAGLIVLTLAALMEAALWIDGRITEHRKPHPLDEFRNKETTP